MVQWDVTNVLSVDMHFLYNIQLLFILNISNIITKSKTWKMIFTIKIMWKMLNYIPLFL